jgi:BirA family biotin operon repressor/biotin-[acetyl-CoA-carboxylase] ligase
MKKIFLDSADSTNDIARKLGEVNTVVVAERQSRGRGRNGRQWISGTGGLYASFVLEKRRLLPIVAAISAAEAIDSFVNADGRCQHSVEVKWPNDILVDGKKTSGILCEGCRDFDIVGVGINVNNDPCLNDATCVRDLIGHDVSVTEMLDSLMSAMEKNFLRPDTDIIAEYRERCGMLGKRVWVKLRDRTVEGIAEIDDDGYLLVGDMRIGVADTIKVEND